MWHPGTQEVVTAVGQECANYLPCIFGPAHVLASTESMLKMAGIVVAAVWTYTLFIRQRQRFPRAVLEHRITHQRIGHGRVLVHVDVVIANLGNTLVRIQRVVMRVRQVRPVRAEQLVRLLRGCGALDRDARPRPEWTVIARRIEQWLKGEIEVEPGETQHLYYDFVLGDRIEVIQIYTHARNVAKHGRHRNPPYGESVRQAVRAGWLLMRAFGEGRYSSTRRRLAARHRPAVWRRRWLGWAVRSMYELTSLSAVDRDSQPADTDRLPGPASAPALTPRRGRTEATAPGIVGAIAVIAAIAAYIRLQVRQHTRDGSMQRFPR